MPRELCKRGNEFITVQVEERVTSSDGRMTFAVSERCPGCTKVFPKLVVRSSDGLGYLPVHGIPVAKHNHKKADAAPVAQVAEESKQEAPEEQPKPKRTRRTTKKADDEPQQQQAESDGTAE